jgi:hypothetical protein
MYYIYTKLMNKMKKKEIYENSYLYIEAAKSFFNVPREKLLPRPQSRNPKNLNASLTWKLLFVPNIKMTFNLTAGVKSNGREIGFCGLF